MKNLHRCSLALTLFVACAGASTFASQARAGVSKASAPFVTLYRFRGGTDGVFPSGGLSADAAGNLYGVTYFGGTPDLKPCPSGCGTVFVLKPNGTTYTESVVYRFQGAADGSNPVDALAIDAAGSLYGAASNSGDPTCQCGTIFKLSRNGDGFSFAVIHTFTGPANDGPDGAFPNGGLAIDASGALYGTAQAGGSPGASGAIFKLSPSGNGYTETILYPFGKPGDGGGSPRTSLILGDDGALFGLGLSSAFEISPSRSGYAYHLLARLNSDRTGMEPLAPFTVGSHGVLYGTTFNGGLSNGQHSTRGLIFSLTPERGGYRETILHEFTRDDGNNPDSKLLPDGNGAFYGVAREGGTPEYMNGVLYKLTRGSTGFSYQILHAFDQSSPRPGGNLLFRPGGSIVGVTAGAIDYGSVYALKI